MLTIFHLPRRKTSVLCGTVGPTEVKVRDEKLGMATVDVLFKTQSGLSGTAEKRLELILKETIESLIITTLHPRSLIQLTFQCINNDGSLLSTSFNVAFLALVNAGVPLCDSFASVTIGISPQGFKQLNPTADDEANATSIHVFVFSQKQEGAYSIQSEGSFTELEFIDCYNLALQATKQIFSEFREILSEKCD
ncbi:Exosome component 5 [Coelomomyces lativittatus]|nr:Exosome component 5 [Coelomomyces lativittatus]